MVNVDCSPCGVGAEFAAPRFTMALRIVYGACLAGLLVAAPAASQSVTADALASFVEESDGQIAPDLPDWEDLLYQAAKANRTPETAIAAFARRIGVSRDAALSYAAVIIEAVVRDETCVGPRERPERPAACRFLPGQPRYERAAVAGNADRSGNLLIVVGKGRWFSRSDHASFFALARKHRAAKAIFSSLLDHSRDPAYLLALAFMGPLTDRLAVVATGEHRESWSRGHAALRLAMIEALEQSASSRWASHEARAALAQWSLSSKLELGLVDEAVSSFQAYPAAIRARLPLPLTACRKVMKDCSDFARSGYALTDELAAALWTTGHRLEAMKLLQEEHPNLDSRWRESVTTYKALSDAIALGPRQRIEDLYPLFIDGRLPDDPPPTFPGVLFSFHGNGWLFTIRDAGLSTRRVVAGRLRAAGHGDMADYLEEVGRPPGAGSADPLLEAVAAMFPPDVSRRRSFWEARLAQVVVPPREVKDASVAVTTRELPVWWTERPLPAAMAAWRDTDPAQTPPDGASLPVDRNAVVRYEEVNGERAIVYLSTEYDLPGETSAAGLWFARTVGGRWSRPLYLGLQRNYPYVATPASNLPLLEGDRLRIEVQVREIDSSTMTFPPVRVDLKRSADGLYLDIDLGVLAADRDGDGLTDIEERRLGLDFTVADSDGDGVPDASDPLPLVRYRASASPRDRLARAIVSAIIGFAPVPIVIPAGDAPTIERVMTGDAAGAAASRRTRTRFLIGDPSMFAHLATPFPLIIYSPRDVEALNRGSAPFLAPQVLQIFSSLDGTQHYVEWSAGWAGGAFTVTCSGQSDADCTTTRISSWIT